jgi:DNA-directed RNA polymerase specialized sigma24 family protein
MAVLDATTDYEALRAESLRVFIRMLRRKSQGSFYDLNDVAEECYQEVWSGWLARQLPDVQTANVVTYIASAMYLKFIDRYVRQSRSIRAELLDDLDAAGAFDARSNSMTPEERVLLLEELALAAEVLDSLEPRQQVVFKAIWSRDRKEKGTPIAGRKLAAAQLGISEQRAKKIGLQANKAIRAAVSRIEDGSWCAQFKETIDTVVAGGESTPEFDAHMRRCVTCRVSTAYLRHRAAIMPLPLLPLAAGPSGLAGLFDHVRGTAASLRTHLAGLVGRHAGAAQTTGGVAAPGAAAGAAGAGAAKVAVVCASGVLAAAGCASVVLGISGLPSPLAGAIATHHTKPTQHARRGPGGGPINVQEQRGPAAHATSSPPILPAIKTVQQDAASAAAAPSRSSGTSTSHRRGGAPTGGGLAFGGQPAPPSTPSANAPATQSSGSGASATTSTSHAPASKSSAAGSGGGLAFGG